MKYPPLFNLIQATMALSLLASSPVFAQETPAAKTSPMTTVDTAAQDKNVAEQLKRVDFWKILEQAKVDFQKYLEDRRNFDLFEARIISKIREMEYGSTERPINADSYQIHLMMRGMPYELDPRAREIVAEQVGSKIADFALRRLLKELKPFDDTRVAGIPSDEKYPISILPVKLANHSDGWELEAGVKMPLKTGSMWPKQWDKELRFEVQAGPGRSKIGEISFRLTRDFGPSNDYFRIEPFYLFARQGEQSGFGIRVGFYHRFQTGRSNPNKKPLVIKKDD